MTHHDKIKLSSIGVKNDLIKKKFGLNSSLVCAIKVDVLLPFRIHEIVIHTAYAFPLPCIPFVRFSLAKGVFLRASHSIFPTAFSLSFAVVETVHFQTVKVLAQRE